MEKKVFSNCILSFDLCFHQKIFPFFTSIKYKCIGLKKMFTRSFCL